LSRFRISQFIGFQQPFSTGLQTEVDHDRQPLEVADAAGYIHGFERSEGLGLFTGKRRALSLERKSKHRQR
jgi:hypothetical protein